MRWHMSTLCPISEHIGDATRINFKGTVWEKWRRRSSLCFPCKSCPSSQHNLRDALVLASQSDVERRGGSISNKPICAFAPWVQLPTNWLSFRRDWPMPPSLSRQSTSGTWLQE